MVQALSRGLKILEILSENGMMTVSEMAKVLQVDKSTVSRLVETLRYHDMVQLNKSARKYQLGLRILNLGTSLQSSLNVIDIARPIIHDVSEELNQSVHLAAFNNTMAYVIDQTVRSSAYSLAANIGMIEPMHASSVGKCILAYRREEKLTQMLEQYEFTKYTERTIINKEDLMQELALIRKQGFAVDDEEVADGVRCIAVPIFDIGKHVKYSLGISGSVDLMTAKKQRYYIERLNYAARRISRELKELKKVETLKRRKEMR